MVRLLEPFRCRSSLLDDYERLPWEKLEVIDSIGAGLITLAVILDFASYWKQIAKTLRTGKSRHVSTSAFMFRMAKDICLLVSLSIYKNWVAVGIHAVALVACTVTLVVVAKHKPRGWKLWG